MLILSDTHVNGSVLCLQNLAQLECILLSNTQVSGSVTSLPLLTDLTKLAVDNTHVGVPTEQQLATFTQQHPDCELLHGE